MAEYTLKANSTSAIAQDVANFNSTVTSIDKMTMAMQGQTSVVLLEYTP